MLRALRLSVSLLTRLPVRAIASPERTLVGAAMAWAPIIGLAIGGIGAGLLLLAEAAGGRGTTLLPAALAIASIVVMTGALHLDGLADTADALGVRGDAARARAVGKEPAIGAFGVTAVVVILLLDVTAVATAASQGRSTTTLVIGSAAGRLAATWACRAEPPATDVGLGAWVARTVRTRSAALSTAATFVIAGVVAATEQSHRISATLTGLAAAGVALLVGAFVRRIGCRAFGGLTGDVLGATISCAATAAYVVVALTGSLVQ
jgi:adenosylcobinamide-GDP ribazoletransferase